MAHDNEGRPCVSSVQSGCGGTEGIGGGGYAGPSRDVTETSGVPLSDRLQGVMNTIEDFFGGQPKVITNPAGDPVLMKDDMKLRLDINNSHGDDPHFHVETQTQSGRWKDAGPEHRYYFKDGNQ